MAANSQHPPVHEIGSREDREASGVMRSAPRTLGGCGEKQLRDLCMTLGMKHQSDLARDVFRRLSGSWQRWPIGLSPAWPTDICDDGTPFEFSLAFEGPVPTLRILVESQRSPIGVHSTWAAGLQLSKSLMEWPGVDLAHHDAVLDLFAPRSTAPVRFSLWHAADISPEGAVSFKAYFNPQVGGAASSLGTTFGGLATARPAVRSGVPGGASP